jgi:hypothetical protein
MSFVAGSVNISLPQRLLACAHAEAFGSSPSSYRKQGEMLRLTTLIMAVGALLVAAPAMAGTVMPVKSAVSINAPLNTARGFVFTGKVTSANPRVSQKDRQVTLFETGIRPLGTILTGAYAGHSKGYWQLTVTGFAGISLHRFDAYVFDRFLPGLWIDCLPASSRVIPF